MRAVRDSDYVAYNRTAYSSGSELSNDNLIWTCDFQVLGEPPADGAGFRRVDTGAKGRKQCCNENPAKVIRTALRFYVAASPQTRAKDVWCYNQSFVNGDGFEYAVTGVIDPVPLVPFDLAINDPATRAEEIELPDWQIQRKIDELTPTVQHGGVDGPVTRAMLQEEVARQAIAALRTERQRMFLANMGSWRVEHVEFRRQYCVDAGRGRVQGAHCSSKLIAGWAFHPPGE